MRDSGMLRGAFGECPEKSYRIIEIRLIESTIFLHLCPHRYDFDGCLLFNASGICPAGGDEGVTERWSANSLNSETREKHHRGQATAL